MAFDLSRILALHRITLIIIEISRSVETLRCVMYPSSHFYASLLDVIENWSS